MKNHTAKSDVVLFEPLESRMLCSITGLNLYGNSVHEKVVHPAHAHHHKVHKVAAAPVRLTSLPLMASMAQSLAAGDPIFMQIPGIEGEVTQVGYEKDIELSSIQWGVAGRHIDLSHSGSNTAVAGKVTSSDVTFTKLMDKASAPLLNLALGGRSISAVSVYFVAVGSSDKPETYAQFTFSNAIVSGYSISSGGDRPSESISLSFTKVQFTYFVTTAGQPTQQLKAGWDFVKGKKI